MPTCTSPAPIGHEHVVLSGGPLDGAKVVIRRGEDEWLHLPPNDYEHLYRRELPWGRTFNYVGGGDQEADGGVKF